MSRPQMAKHPKIKTTPEKSASGRPEFIADPIELPEHVISAIETTSGTLEWSSRNLAANSSSRRDLRGFVQNPRAAVRILMRLTGLLRF
jgi:hypothetical protein